MVGLRPIPRRLLPDSMDVRVLLADGVFADAVTVFGVRFDCEQSASEEAHRCADAGAGKVYMDAVNTDGAFQVPAGSRVDIAGHSYLVAESRRCEDFNGHVHHWELVVR